ncbi:MAG TPA: histone deacetylase [Gemmatimonadales bacterium]|nr:histone deacetylase [Gemmatimonadales bacterium]
MPVAVFTHADCLRHDPGPDHPETPARLRVLLARLRREPAVVLHDVAPAPRPALVAVHGDAYLRSVEALSARGGGPLFLDTILNRASWPAALGAAGAALAAVDHAHAGMGHAFAAVRPPGHHALASRGMGFCLINNVVVAARQAQRFGRARVLIVDWDVHHGNGTQALVETDPSIRYVSLHQWPWYPGTGAAEERGVGNVFNVPRGPGHPPELYVGDLWAAIVAATTDWTPDLTLISAGFDAMRGDPLGGFTLEPAHYADLTHRLRERLPHAPVVGVLEGGYIPERLAEGAAAHVLALA